MGTMSLLVKNMPSVADVAGATKSILGGRVATLVKRAGCFNSCGIWGVQPCEEGVDGCNPCRKHGTAKTPPSLGSISFIPLPTRCPKGRHAWCQSPSFTYRCSRVRVLFRWRSSGRFGLRGGGCRAFSEDLYRV